MADTLKRQPITDAQADAILAVPPSDYDSALIRSWFAHGENGKEPLYEATGLLTVGPRHQAPPSGDRPEGHWDCRFASNWAEVRTTTPGRIVPNSLIFCRSKELRAAFPYYDQPWDKGLLGKIQQRVADSLIEGRISYEDAEWTINSMQWLFFSAASYLNPSLTIDTIRAPKRVKEEKKRLLAGEQGAAIRAGDLKALGDFEGALLAMSKQELDGKDPGFDIYASGARGSFANNFKQTAVARGAIRKSDDPSVISVSTASLEEGVPESETHLYADIMVSASYGRAVSTQIGGYLAKQLAAGFQSVTLDPDPASDCGSGRFLRVAIKRPGEFRYRFAAGPGGRLVEITMENEAQYLGKSVDLRTPLYCRKDGPICSRCAGTLYYRMGILNIGVLAWKAGASIMQAALKGFHDTTLKLNRVHLEDFTKEIPRGDDYDSLTVPAQS